MIQTAEVQVKANKLLEKYSSFFEIKFSKKPLLEVSKDMEDCRWLVENVGFLESCDLLASYFHIHDEWILGQGYSLSWFRNNINKVIAKAGTSFSRAADRPFYVVHFSTHGIPVLSHNPNAMKGETKLKPTLYTDWLKLDVAGKLGISKEEWNSAENDTTEWVETWKREGYLPSGDKKENLPW